VSFVGVNTLLSKARGIEVRGSPILYSEDNDEFLFDGKAVKLFVSVLTTLE
jgi:hypothetical protein